MPRSFLESLVAALCVLGVLALSGYWLLKVGNIVAGVGTYCGGLAVLVRWVMRANER